MPDDRIPMTRDGYEKLKAELEQMFKTEMRDCDQNAFAMIDALGEAIGYAMAGEDAAVEEIPSPRTAFGMLGGGVW